MHCCIQSRGYHVGEERILYHGLKKRQYVDANDRIKSEVHRNIKNAPSLSQLLRKQDGVATAERQRKDRQAHPGCDSADVKKINWTIYFFLIEESVKDLSSCEHDH